MPRGIHIDLLLGLRRVTDGLAGAATVDDVAGVVVGALTEAAGASAGSLALADGGEVRIAAASGYPHDLLKRFSRFPVTADLPLAHAVRRAEPVFLGTPIQVLQQYPHLAPFLERTGNAALAAIPVVVRSHVIGAVGLSYLRDQDFQPRAAAFLVALTGQCALALNSCLARDARAPPAAPRAT